MAATSDEVTGLLDQFCEALARRDVDGVLRLFVPGDNVTVVTSDDAVLRRRRDWEAFVGRYVSGVVTYSWEWERHTVAAAGGVAWLLAEGVETATQAGQVQRTPYRMTMVCTCRGGRWLIAQLHGSSPHHAG